MKENPTVITLLIIAIGALAGVIVWLALYIRSLHNKSIERQQGNKEQLIKVITENTIMNTRMESAIHANTKATEKGAEVMGGSMDRMSTVVNDLHKYILTATHN